jgi:type II secretory pathway predicted ATPase ExeA
VSIDRLRAHYGFSRMPFGKDLAPGMLHAHAAHGEAVARIGWCISEQAIGVISGECGAGKTVAARAAVAGLDASRHTILYLGTPGVGLRGIYGLIITTLGRDAAVSSRRADPPGAGAVGGRERSVASTSW